MKISRFCVTSCLFLRKKFLFASEIFSSSTRGTSNKIDTGSQQVHFQFDCYILFFFAVFCSFLCVMFSSQNTIVKCSTVPLKLLSSLLFVCFACTSLFTSHDLYNHAFFLHLSLSSAFIFLLKTILLIFLVLVDSLSVNQVSKILTTIIIHKQIQLVNTVTQSKYL